MKYEVPDLSEIHENRIEQLESLIPLKGDTISFEVPLEGQDVTLHVGGLKYPIQDSAHEGIIFGMWEQGKHGQIPVARAEFFAQDDTTLRFMGSLINKGEKPDDTEKKVWNKYTNLANSHLGNTATAFIVSSTYRANRTNIETRGPDIEHLGQLFFATCMYTANRNGYEVLEARGDHTITGRRNIWRAYDQKHDAILKPESSFYLKYAEAAKVPKIPGIFTIRTRPTPPQYYLMQHYYTN